MNNMDESEFDIINFSELDDISDTPRKESNLTALFRTYTYLINIFWNSILISNFNPSKFGHQRRRG